MKIVKMVVTGEDGVEHMFEGEGYLSVPRSTNAKGKPYVKAVTATIRFEGVELKSGV